MIQLEREYWALYLFIYFRSFAKALWRIGRWLAQYNHEDPSPDPRYSYKARCGNTCLQSLCWEVGPQGLLEHTGHPIAELVNTGFVRDSVAKNKEVGAGEMGQLSRQWFSICGLHIKYPA